MEAFSLHRERRRYEADIGRHAGNDQVLHAFEEMESARTREILYHATASRPYFSAKN
jgi:hypothetical protein